MALPSLGTLGSRYQLLSTLGASVSHVYRARDRVSGALVAVKVLEGIDARARAAIRREMAALRCARLPGIVNLLDDGHDGGTFFIVTEVVTGAPFPGLAPPAAWADIEAAACALLEAAGRLHAIGLAHGDLKPDNVLVSPDRQRVTLIDLGLTAGGGRTGRALPRGALVGTPLYMAPELFRAGPVSPAADLYAVGVMLYAALAGEPPHAAPSFAALVRGRLHQPAPRLLHAAPDTPSRVAGVVDALLEREAAARPGSAAETLDRLLGQGSRSALGAPSRAELSARLGDGNADAAALAELFHGPDRLFHAREDAANELFQRTEGDPARVHAELSSWIAAGLAHAEGGRLALASGALARLIGGGALRALPPPPAPLPTSLDDVLSACILAGGAATVGLVAAVLARDEAEVGRAAADLVARGALRRRPDGRLCPLQSAGGTPLGDRATAHAAIARALPPGSSGRLGHLVASGAVEEAVGEALRVGEDCLQRGRLEDGLAAVREGLATARSGELPDLEPPLLALALRLAFLIGRPLGLDQVLQEIGWALSQEVRIEPLDQLTRAILATLGADAPRARRLADALDPFPDVELDRVRMATRVLAARRSSLEVEEAMLEEATRWAEGRSSRAAWAAHAGWLGRLRYRQERFDEAAALHARCAEGSDALTIRISAQLNCASSLLEAGCAAEAEELARAVVGVCRVQRQPAWEGRAAWLERAARYRAARRMTTDLELVDAIASLQLPDLEACACLTEAAIAWRNGETKPTAALATRASEGWRAMGKRWPALLAHALRLRTEAAPDADQLGEAAALAGECPSPGIALQVWGLLAQVAGPRAEWGVAARARTLPAARRRLRLEVLSVDEALDALGVGG